MALSPSCHMPCFLECYLLCLRHFFFYSKSCFLKKCADKIHVHPLFTCQTNDNLFFLNVGNETAVRPVGIKIVSDRTDIGSVFP